MFRKARHHFVVSFLLYFISYTQLLSADLLAPIITNVNPSQGPANGGNTITVTGANFTDASSVFFDLVGAADFLVISDTSIIVKTPAGIPGVANVTVTTPGGTSNLTSSDEYTYFAPVITGISPNRGSANGYNTITIKGNNFLGVQSVYFGSIPAIHVTVTFNTLITVVVPPGVLARVDVIVSGPAADSTLSQASQYVYVAPYITNLSQNAGPAAGGNKITLTGINLSGITSVLFGATETTHFTVHSDYTVTVIAPPGPPESVDISVSGPYASSICNQATRYTYFPSPSLANVSPNSGPAGGENKVTLTGNNFSGVKSIRFSSVSTTDFVVNSDTSITVTVPPDAPGNVDIVITEIGGDSVINASCQYTYLPVEPPSDFIGKIIKKSADKKTEADRIHRLSWSESPDPTVVSYNLYQNDKLVKTVDKKRSCKADFNKRNKDKTYTYTLTAVNKQGVESESLKVKLK